MSDYHPTNFGPTPTPAEVLAGVEAMLKARRAMDEFQHAVYTAIGEAQQLGCGILIIGTPPDADIEVSELVPAGNVYVLPKGRPQ